jgi:hypothetical protein
MAHLLARGLVALALAAALATAAHSEGIEEAHGVDVADACHDDAKRLCPGVWPGRGRIAGCLVAQMPAVSRECHHALSMVAALKSCQLDYHRFCRGVQPGGGRVYHCLGGNARELSPPCNAALKANVPGYRGY